MTIELVERDGNYDATEAAAHVPGFLVFPDSQEPLVALRLMFGTREQVQRVVELLQKSLDAGVPVMELQLPVIPNAVTRALLDHVADAKTEPPPPPARLTLQQWLNDAPAFLPPDDVELLYRMVRGNAEQDGEERDPTLNEVVVARVLRWLVSAVSNIQAEDHPSDTAVLELSIFDVELDDDGNPVPRVHFKETMETTSECARLVGA